MFRHIEIAFQVEGKEKVVVPDNAKKGAICPYRKDCFQGYCWTCDLCGRNEASEHGASFPTVEVAGFSFYKENISNERLMENEFVFEYGDKTIFIDIQYLTEWCEKTFPEIWGMMEELENNRYVEDNLIYYDGVDYIKHHDEVNRTFFHINRRWTSFNKILDSQEAVICFLTDVDPNRNDIGQTFLELIDWQNEAILTQEDWEDIYGYDL